jgi:hypothetical protein
MSWPPTERLSTAGVKPRSTPSTVTRAPGVSEASTTVPDGAAFSSSAMSRRVVLPALMTTSLRTTR